MTKAKAEEAKTRMEQLIDLIFGEPKSEVKEYDPPKSEWTDHERGFYQAGFIAGFEEARKK